jgi:hypothetical protein
MGRYGNTEVRRTFSSRLARQVGPGSWDERIHESPIDCVQRRGKAGHYTSTVQGGGRQRSGKLAAVIIRKRLPAVVAQTKHTDCSLAGQGGGKRCGEYRQAAGCVEIF